MAYVINLDLQQTLHTKYDEQVVVHHLRDDQIQILTADFFSFLVKLSLNRSYSLTELMDVASEVFGAPLEVDEQEYFIQELLKNGVIRQE